VSFSTATTYPYMPTTISGCSDQPVSMNASGSYTATCTSGFEATPGTHSGDTQGGVSLGATFTPDANSGVTGSSAVIQHGSPQLFVNPDPVNIALVVSNSDLMAGQSGTATGTVTPTFTGPYEPTGNVVFTDVLYGVAIGSCGGKSGVPVNAAGQATCTFSLDQNQANDSDSIYATYPFGTDAGEDYAFQGQQASNPVTVSAGTSSGSGPSSGGGKSASSGTVTLGKPKTSGATLQVLAACAAGGASCVDQYQVSVTEKVLKGRVVGITASKAKPVKTTKVVVLGSAKVTLAAGKRTTVKLTLNGAGKKLLVKHRTLKCKLAVTTKNGTKTQTLKTATVTFKAPKKHKG
jgi:hypothetical protein